MPRKTVVGTVTVVDSVVSAVSGVITAAITAAQIGTVNASQIVAGAINASQIGSLPVRFIDPPYSLIMSALVVGRKLYEGVRIATWNSHLIVEFSSGCVPPVCPDLCPVAYYVRTEDDQSKVIYGRTERLQRLQGTQQIAIRVDEIKDIEPLVAAVTLAPLRADALGIEAA